MDQLIRLAGVTFEGRQQTIAILTMTDDIYLERDYNNIYDHNAIGVFNQYQESIGWIPKETAKWLAPRIDSGEYFEAVISRILGGYDGLSYGIEILLMVPEKVSMEVIDEDEDEDEVDEEWLKRQEQILAILNRPQTKEEQEEAERSFNESWRRLLELDILEGHFEKLHTQINNHWLTLGKIKDFTQFYFNTGRFENCYKALNTLNTLANYYRDHNIIEFCNDNIRIFKTYGYHQPLPEPTIENYPQSIENSDESYPDLDRIYQQSLDSLLDALNEEIDSSNFEVKGAALFTLGELHLLNNNITDAIGLYSAAIFENPNKALYWGYKAQLLNRNQVHPFISTRLLMKAMELDPNNPRWHFLQSILLAKISEEEENEELLPQAVYEARLALDLLRPDQEGLRKAILSLFGEKAEEM